MPGSSMCSQLVRCPHFLMENSINALFVGLDVIENMPSPTPGTEIMAHCPGRWSKGFFPSRVRMRKVLTSGVSMRTSSTTTGWGIRVSLFILPLR